MRIHHVKIENFRGIKSLEWTISSAYCCLVGPGDTRKSSILRAISYVFHPSHELQIDDFDFYQCDTSLTISIWVTLSGFPSDLLAENKFGFLLRGVKPEGMIVDDPVADSVPALTVRLTINSDLAPEWYVVKDSNPEGERLGNADRASMGVLQIEEEGDNYFSWRRGYPLSRLSECRDEISDALVKAHRSAATSITDASVPSSSLGKSKLQEIASQIGVNIKGELGVGLDYERVGRNLGYVSLQHGKVEPPPL